MTTNGKITVSVWSEPPRPVFAAKRTQRRLGLPGAIGIAGTLLLHALAFEATLLGTRQIQPPVFQVSGSARNQSKGQPAESLTLIELPMITLSDNGPVREEIKETPITQISPDLLRPPHNVGISAPDEEKDSTLSADGGGGDEHAQLLGIYSGQIQARVERIWRRPRTPVNERSHLFRSAEYFGCQVQIVQDSRGNVQETLLTDCNGSAAWQHSITVAIQQASPLPAPPSPTVFSPTLTLNFVGYEYVAGGSEEGYEAKLDTVARATIDRPSPRVPNASKQ